MKIVVAVPSGSSTKAMPAGPASVPPSPGRRRRFVRTAVPGHGSDDFGLGIHLPDSVVMHVGDIESPFAPAISLGIKRCALVAGPPSPSGPCPRFAVARNGVDGAGRVIDHPNPVVQCIGDVDVAVRRRGHTAFGVFSAASIAGLSSPS